MLTFVEGEPAFAPVPSGDEVVSAIGRLLRRAHDAQEGFAPPDDAVALAATYWAGLRIDDQLQTWGIPLGRRVERLRILCDSYGLDALQRSRLLDELIAQRRGRLERGDWRVANRQTVLANLLWLEEHRAELDTVLA
jgi:hypothetical protein